MAIRLGMLGIRAANGGMGVEQRKMLQIWQMLEDHFRDALVVIADDELAQMITASNRFLLRSSTGKRASTLHMMFDPVLYGSNLSGNGTLVLPGTVDALCGVLFMQHMLHKIMYWRAQARYAISDEEVFAWVEDALLILAERQDQIRELVPSGYASQASVGWENGQPSSKLLNLRQRVAMLIQDVLHTAAKNDPRANRLGLMAETAPLDLLADGRFHTKFPPTYGFIDYAFEKVPVLCEELVFPGVVLALNPVFEIWTSRTSNPNSESVSDIVGMQIATLAKRAPVSDDFHHHQRNLPECPF